MRRGEADPKKSIPYNSGSAFPKKAKPLSADRMIVYRMGVSVKFFTTMAKAM